MARWLDPQGQEGGQFWDQTLLKDIGVDETNATVIPGRYFDRPHTDDFKIIIGDEEALYPAEKLEGISWLQSPHQNAYKNITRYIPIGYTPHTRPTLHKLGLPDKSLRWVFAGQKTHARRKQLVQYLQPLEDGFLLQTDGFTQGLTPEQYIEKLWSAKVAPCPSGAVIPDTFRVYEALEAQCVPLLDGLDPKGGSENYWYHLFGEHPLPVIEHWQDAPGTINYFCDTYPYKQNRVSAWWQQYKHQMRRWLRIDSNMPNERLTVLVATSPIMSHPDTKIIEETLDSIRHHTDAPIYIMCDGVRPEQQHYKENYEEYLRKLVWLTNFKYENVVPWIYDEHLHQAEMTSRTLKHVDTEYIMFVEHDTPLVTDYKIPFNQIYSCLADADLVRLHHEAGIHPEHQHLMVPDSYKNFGTHRFQKTAQWSQRPHIATTAYYRRILDQYFDGGKTMIEDRMHGITQQGWLERGLPGWQDHRLYMYTPEGNMKRSYHLDGRGTDPKWGES